MSPSIWGDFDNSYIGGERKRQVELGFELDPKRLSGPRGPELLGSASKVVVELAIGEGITSKQRDLIVDQIRDLDREVRAQSGALCGRSGWCIAVFHEVHEQAGCCAWIDSNATIPFRVNFFEDS